MKYFNSFRERLIPFFSLSMLMLLLSLNALAQPVYNNGLTGTSANSFPFNIGSSGSNKVQWLYRNTYFPTAPSGTITDIYFRTTASAASFSMTGVEIRMGQSTLATFPSGAWITGLSLVYTASSVTVTKLTNGWLRFTLQTPFQYDNTKNFVVEAICMNSSGATMIQNSTAPTGRIYGNYLAASGTSNTGLVDFGFDLLPKKGMNNAAVASVATPTGTFCAGVTLPVSVNVKNFGYNQINNVKVNWLLDGVPQPQISWNTMIDTVGSVPGNNAVVNLGNVFFGTAARTFKVYTSLPNGLADTVNTNDTLNFTLGAALSGTFTVGGTTPDFPNVVAAAAALNQYGVCGPTTFNIRPGTYVGSVVLNAINGASATNRILFQPEDGNTTSVNINYSSTGTTDNVLSLNGTSFVHFKKLNFNSTGTTYGYAVGMTGAVSNDSITNCRITTSIIASSNFAAMYMTSLSGTNNNMVFQNNTITGGYYGFFWNGNSASYASGMVVENNNISGVYYYASYIYYTNGLKYRYNTVAGTTTSYYNTYIYNPYQSPDISYNRVDGQYGYGFMIYYAQGNNATTDKANISNNVVTMGGVNNFGGIYLYGPNNTNIYNNTAYDYGTYTTSYTTYLYMSGYSGNDVKNNLSVNTGGGYAIYMYGASASNPVDYNNWFTTNTSTFGYNNGTAYTGFVLYRNSTGGQERNSLSYNPGLLSNGIPDVSNPAAWALNGRGVHITTNNKDILGNPRPTTLAAGVPDIGAYELDPQSIPPDATAIPANATPGSKQYFTFGFDTVATITWNASLGITSPLTVKLYSGRKAPGFSAVSPNRSMYFYTDIKSTGSGNTYDFNADIYYNDPWLGTMGPEANIKLAEKFGNYPWFAYNGALSSSNVTRNFISAAGLTSFGSYTGIDTAILSAIAQPKGSTIICTGSYVTLKANKATGYTYQWNMNGNAIAGATLDSFLAFNAGDYTVTITSGSNSATSIPITVAVVPAPMAIVGASGALTYCTGSNLQLNAGTGAGLTYQWQNNGNNINGATNPTYTVAGPGSYTVVVRNIGCGTTSPAAVVTPGPLNVNLGSDTTFCEVKNQAFKLSAGYPGAKYRWSTGDTTQSISITKGSGAFSVLVDAGPNCIDRDTINVVVKPLPNITGISFIGSGTNYTFNTAGAQNASSFLWMFTDGTTSTQTQVTKNFPDGNVIVKLVAFNECGSDTSALINWATNVNTTNAEGYSLSLYPNPAKEKCTVSVEGNVFITDVTLLNAVGQVVYKTTLGAEAKSHTIDVARFAAGHYILRANTTNGSVTKSMNIER